MRFYDIQIEGDYPIRYTSWVENRPDPGALLVEMDIPVAPFATPFGNPWVRVHGISVQQISQAVNLKGQTISVYGGMKPGLPLATSAAEDQQAGLLAKGEIYQAYGNWIGNTQTLDIVMLANGNSVDQLNIVLDWKEGTPLEQALKTALNTALPGVPVNIQISPNLVLPRYDGGPYTSLESFGQHIRAVTKPILGEGYEGVEIVMQNGAVSVFDGTASTASTGRGPTTTSGPKKIRFHDLIGQPTWIEYPTIQLAAVMRADLSVGDTIVLPEGQYTTTQQSQSQFRDKSTQQGSFLIKSVHHVGNSRAPGAGNWTTVIDAVPVKG